MYYFQRSPVLVPIDYSDASLRALRVAMTMCDKPEKLTVIYVAPRMELLIPTNESGKSLTEDEVRESDLKRMAAWLQENGIASAVNQRVLFGDPGYRITEYQKENKFPLVVMPSHGRHGLKRILLEA